MRFCLVLSCFLLSTGNSIQSPADIDEDSEETSSTEDASSYTKLYLHTKDSGDDYTEVEFCNLSTVAGLDVSKPTKVFIHGWMDSAFINAELLIRKAYMAEQDVNVLSVDWSDKTDSWWYPTPRAAVEPVGKYLAAVVDWLVSEAGVSVDLVHVIGHSLGAHIGGVVGEHVTVGSLGRITGLDPAAPGFGSSTSGRLDSSDAQFVDVIHTCGGLLGYYDPIGHVDFYPNKGTYNQPGCSIDLGMCSHGRSNHLFAESISGEGFVSIPCETWQSFVDGICDSNSTAVMGEHVDTSTRGVYYLYTSESSPYAMNGQKTTTD